MDSKQISRELRRTFLRYRAGLIDIQQAKQELALFQAMLKAEEQAIIERKLEAIETVLEARR